MDSLNLYDRFLLSASQKGRANDLVLRLRIDVLLEKREVECMVSSVASRLNALIILEAGLGVPCQQHKDVDCKAQESHQMVPDQPATQVHDKISVKRTILHTGIASLNVSKAAEIKDK